MTDDRFSSIAEDLFSRFVEKEHPVIFLYGDESLVGVLNGALQNGNMLSLFGACVHERLP
jgi:hypothetical protein